MGHKCDHATILSGDITGSNTYHVVSCTDGNFTMIIDGFTVKDGDADGNSSMFQNQGGGVHIRDTNLCMGGGPTLRNCFFRDNSATAHGAVNDHASATVIDNCVFLDNDAGVQGAGLNIDNGSTTVTDCIFTNNDATNSTGKGGAIWMGHRTDLGCPSTSTPTVTDCTITGNDSDQGGAVWFEDSTPTFTDCTFSGNTAFSGDDAEQGGAVWFDTSTATFVDCTFSENSAKEGGAVWFQQDNTNTGTIFTRCLFEDNLSLFGGGVYAILAGDSTDSVRFEECEFLNNTTVALADGAGMWLAGCFVDVVRCTFDGNENGIGAYGGGLYVQGGTTRVIDSQFTNNGAANNLNCKRGGGLYFQGGVNEVIGCTVADNRGTNGGGIWTNGSTALEVTNTILWNNTNAEIFVESGSASPVVAYSCVDDGGYAGTGNIADDPNFLSPDGDCGSYHLDESTSDCVDAGTEDAAQGSIDNCLDTREKYCAVDMGAYEAQDDPSHTCCPTPGCSGDDPCCNGTCCTGDERCCTNVCRPPSGTWCCDDSECTGGTPVCKLETGDCVECLDDNDCGFMETCNQQTNQCEGGPPRI